MPDSSFPRFAPRVCSTSLPSSNRQAAFPSGGGRREPRAYKPPECRHQAGAVASAGPAPRPPPLAPRAAKEPCGGPASPTASALPALPLPLLQPDKPTASPTPQRGQEPPGAEQGSDWAPQVKTPAAGGTRQPQPRLGPLAADTHKQREPSPRRAGTSPHLRPRLRPASTPGTPRR